MNHTVHETDWFALLSDEERRILEGTPFPGLRPGDNLWPEIAIVDIKTGEVIGDGALVDSMIRRKLLVGQKMWAPKVDRHPEGFRLEFSYLYRPNPNLNDFLD